MVDTIDIKTLNISELLGVINTYPWYAGAREELCERMAASGAWSEAQFAQTAIYIGSRNIIANILRKNREKDYSDKNIAELLTSCTNKPKIVVVGGDFFSQSQYDKVRQSSDSVFSSFKACGEEVDFVAPEIDESDICTETLAQIYEDQGYLTEAIDIYSKLSLRYPEKSAYFAALIEKIDNK